MSEEGENRSASNGSGFDSQPTGDPSLRLESSAWYEQNDAFLEAALEWLRLKLELLALNTSQPAGAIFQPQSSPTTLKRTFQLFKSQPVSEPVLALPAPSPVTEEMIAQAAAKMEAAAKGDPPPALHILAFRFGLSHFEREILLLCAALELDPSIPELCARAQNSPDFPYPSFGLAINLFSNPAWDALSAGRPLRYWRLIEVSQPAPQRLTGAPLRADERIVAYIKGLNQLDDRLAPLLVPFDSGEEPLPPSQEVMVGQIAADLKRWDPNTRPPLIQLIGSDSLSKQAVMRRAIAGMGWQAYRLPAGLLPSTLPELERFTRLWQRESTLLPIALFIEMPEAGDAGRSPEHSAALHHFLNRCGTVVFLDAVEPLPGLGVTANTVEVRKPTPAEQAAAWRMILGNDAGDLPAQLAAQFNLNLPSIRAIARRLPIRRLTNENRENLRARLWEECLAYTRPHLDRLAQRIEVKASWRELILPQEPLDQLHEIASQVRGRTRVYDEWGFRHTMNRGYGISALFIGPSGAGKSMAAEVIAQELNLYLYRIDLSAVVSKYIGETEKNLRQVFDAAEDGGAILFFDEADALFGKRSEVKDSHDRYANIEINYLLQRMEAFGGLAILATNMKNALDPAFWRRLRFIVNFPFPGPAERRRIWEQVLPPQTPRLDLDYESLARLNLTGGSIHNVGLNAAFLAARTNIPVTMELIYAAARSEYRKLERPINEADFRPARPAEVRR